MANCHDLFNSYYKVIALSSSNKKKLKESSNAIRKRIKDNFRLKERTQPKFYHQGSYMMKTIINPLDNEYDIDDGVYLQNLDDDLSKWPTPETVHGWIVDAVKDHTNNAPVDKNTCVRVIYSGEWHVDLPIYSEYKQEYYLAEKGEKGWHVSDSKAIVDWFRGRVNDKGEQLRKMVVYFKGWADNKSSNGKLPSGLVLTILMEESFQKHDRDDVCFADAINKIHSRLVSNSIINNPADSSENLYAKCTDTIKIRFLDLLKTLKDVAANALSDDNKVEACKNWRKEFGDRWTNCEELADDSCAKYTAAPALLKDDNRSAL